ncbi:putative reverse transcriptase domain-containing protein [Tanacetum coccineum]
MFYSDMVRIGAVPKPPSDDEDTERPRKKSKNSTSDGTEGPSEPLSRTSLLELYSIRWIMPPKAMFEARMREVIREQVATSMAKFMPNMTVEPVADGSRGDGSRWCLERWCWSYGVESVVLAVGDAELVVLEPGVLDQQWPEILGEFANCTLQGRAMPWWNVRFASMGIAAANGYSMDVGKKRGMKEEFCPRSVLQRLEQELYNLKLKGTDIDGYTNRFHELALLCPRMVEPEQVKVEQYIHRLSKNIRGDVTSSRPTGIDEAVRMDYQLMGQIIQDKTDEVSEGEKGKGEGDRGGRGDN